MSEEEYQPVVDRFLTAIDEDPSLLLDPLVERMTRMSNELRYEEAGWVRDRHNALARSLERRHRWQSLQNAGLMEIEGEDGRILIVDHGMFAGSRDAGSLPELHPGEVDTGTEVPETVALAEEAELVWRWLNGSQVRLVTATGYLAFPSRRVTKLTMPGRIAA
jgi:DNA polymerase-3 subunit epsilon